MKLLKLILIIILFSSCQINDKEREKAIHRYSMYTIDEIEFMMHNIYAKRLTRWEKESLELAKKVYDNLRKNQDTKKCILLIKEALESGLYKKKLHLSLEEEEKLYQRILDAENLSDKYEQIKEVRSLVTDLLYIRGMRIDAPELILTYSDTLELAPNKNYKFPIKIIYKHVGGTVFKNHKDINEIEIITGEATDSIEEKLIEFKVQNKLTDEVWKLEKKVYIDIKKND